MSEKSGGGICDQCHTPFLPGAEFCMECGNRLQISNYKCRSEQPMPPPMLPIVRELSQPLQFPLTGAPKGVKARLHPPQSSIVGALSQEHLTFTIGPTLTNTPGEKMPITTMKGLRDISGTELTFPNESNENPLSTMLPSVPETKQIDEQKLSMLLKFL